MIDTRPIGVLDSGVGGLTVAKELKKLLPGENIIYFGDNANVPYGNKSEKEIYRLTKKMVDFLIEKDAKMIAIACNTISSLLDKYFKDYQVPIVSIIKPAANYVVKNNITKVGVIATKFTIESGTYQNLIKAGNKGTKVVAEPSPDLAAVVDSANFTDKQVDQIVDLHISNMFKEEELSHIILGCTHYPIVLENFQKRAPKTEFINPAYEQVLFMKDLMDKEKIIGAQDGGSFRVYTTGSSQTYTRMMELLNMDHPDEIKELDTDF